MIGTVANLVVADNAGVNQMFAVTRVLTSDPENVPSDSLVLIQNHTYTCTVYTEHISL